MTKKRVMFFVCVSLLLAISLSVGSYAADGTFEKTKTYPDGSFSDLAASAWYYNDVVSAYELGLMKGMSAETFSPDGTVTVAEGITIAARMHHLYNGGNGEFTQGDPWYQVYVDYALAQGFIADGQYDGFDREIKRHEMAVLFADALPAEYYGAINSVSAIPDVARGAKYADKLLMLYNAGIVMGNDEYGSFLPNNNIRRSEASAIINRVAIPANRLTKTLKDKPYGDAVYLIDSITMNRGQKGLTSGWDYDNRYQIMNTNDSQTHTLADSSSQAEFSLRRPITPQSTGVMTLEMVASLSGAKNGAYFLFTQNKGDDAFKIYTQDGMFWAMGDSAVQLPYEYKNGVYRIKAVMDLDARIAQIFINGVDCGTAAMSSGFAEIDLFRIGTTKEGTLSITPSWVQLYINYLVNDTFYMTQPNNPPLGWDVVGDMTVKQINSSGLADSNSVYVEAAVGSSHVANRSFTPVDGNVIFESYVLLPVGTSGAYVSLNSGDTEAVKIYTEGNTFKNGSGTALRNYMNNIWQCLRIEANTETQKALFRINGKTIGEYAFDNEASYFDNLSVGFAPAADSVMWFDDVQVFKYDEPADYVPVPNPAKAQGYYVGMNVCSLWRNDHHTGWDAIAPYPDLEPILGFYDEGLREVADWEIKIMVENGIDYQHLCWYCPSGDLQTPIKTSRMNDALHDGFFNAKYSDMMKFNFMWENNGQNVSSIEQFKKYLWPYWVEYYFTDPRFMTMDNKPIITVWSYSRFISAFGGEQGAREAVRFMNEDIKNYGFDGMIILFADGHQMSKSYFDGVAKIGADGTYGYHWQITGKDAEHQIYRMTTQQAFGSTHIVPTVSVGFNNVGWSGERKDMISLEGHKQVLEFIRDTFLPKYKNASEDWKKKALLVSTWNEYGEGTYVMPAGVHGYGYMNNVRSTLTDAAGAPDNLLPTPSQKARLGYLFPATRTWIKPLGYDTQAMLEAVPTAVVKKWDMSNKAQAAEWKDAFRISGFDNKNGVLSGTASGEDFAIRPVTDNLGLELDKITHIHIKMKVSEPGMLEIFFKTAQDDTWTQEKGASVSLSKKDEYHDYYIDMREKSAWTGTLTEFRIDPNNAISSFEISLIEFLAPSAEEIAAKVILNNYEMQFDFDPEVKNDEFYVTANPDKGFFSMLSVFHQYSRFTGVLSLASEKHEIVFTVGSSTAYVDGAAVDIGYEVYTKDGLPVLPLKFILDKLGHSYQADGKSLTATTIDDSYIQALEDRVPFQYEFNIPNDAEGWKAGNASIAIGDGVLSGMSVAQNTSGMPNYDPALTSPDLNFSADAYKTIVVRMKYEYEPIEGRQYEQVVVYFKTQEQNSLDEKKTVRLTFETNSSGDEFEEFMFDMSENELWRGVVTGIRFDPFNNDGTFVVDYIRFIRDPNVEDSGVIVTTPAPAVPTSNLTDSVVNGDAENASNVAFFSDNATISVISDPTKPGNHVYSVMSKPGKNWVYFRQKVKFVPGKTYVVEFDIKIVGTNDGAEETLASEVFVNLIYDDLPTKDHNVGVGKYDTDSGWVHIKKEFKVDAKTDERSMDEFSIYVNPIGELSVNYLIDNVKLTAK